MRRSREGLTGLVFVSDGRAVLVSFAVAASRLEELVRGRLLDGVSERVYEGGVEYLLRVGPAGSVPGFSRLVRVRFAEPVHLDGAVSVALRWEATGAVGGLFPALDADIRLAPDGGDHCRVTLTGSYRSSLGILGEQLDRLVLHTVATATSTALLARIAAALKDAPARLLSRATCGSQARHLNPLPADTPDSTGTGKP